MENKKNINDSDPSRNEPETPIFNGVKYEGETHYNEDYEPVEEKTND